MGHARQFNIYCGLSVWGPHGDAPSQNRGWILSDTVLRVCHSLLWPRRCAKPSAYYYVSSICTLYLKPTIFPSQLTQDTRQSFHSFTLYLTVDSGFGLDTEEPDEGLLVLLCQHCLYTAPVCPLSTDRSPKMRNSSQVSSLQSSEPKQTQI